MRASRLLPRYLACPGKGQGVEPMTKTVRVLCLWSLFLLLQGSSAALSPSQLSTQRGFEPNRGQFADASAAYVSRLSGYVVALDASGASFYSYDGIRVRRLRLQLRGANPGSVPGGEDVLLGKVNYLAGDNPAQSLTGIPTFGRVHARDVYPGIDVVYYRNGDSDLEHDFIVAPNADPSRIVVAISGADRVSLDGREAVIASGRARFRLRRPVAYQEIDGVRRPVVAEYTLHHHKVGFRLGPYDRTRPLVIDPVLVFSRYLGGSYTLNADRVTSVAADSAGNAFVATLTPSTDFPLLQPLYATGGIFVSAVTKVNAAGIMVFSTYLSANSSTNYTSGTRLTTDSSGNVYLVGIKAVQQPSTAFLNNFIVNKISADGSKLIYAFVISDSGADSGGIVNQQSGPGIAVDSSGNAYVVGNTGSNDFPIVNGNSRPSDAIAPGGLYAFRVNAAGTALDWSTYIANEGSVVDVAIDGTGNIVFGGTLTNPTALNATRMTATFGAFQTSRGGGDDVFVGKLSSSGSLIYLTFLGGSSNDDAHDVSADANGNAYVTGATASNNFPTANADPSYCKATGAACPAFVTKIDPAGDALVFSTRIGGSTGLGGSTAYGESGMAIRADVNGNVWVAGDTTSTDFPTLNPLQSSCSIGSNVCQDVFVSEFSASGSLLFSTFFGKTGVDVAGAIAVSPAIDVFVGGLTYSTDFPKQGPTSSYGGYGDGFIFKVAVTPRAELISVPSSYTFANTLNIGYVLGATLTLASTGTQPVTVSSFTSTNSDFSAGGGNCINTPMNPGSTCTFSVQFSPTAGGLRQTNITVNSNADATPLLIHVSGTGAFNPAASLSPSPLSFPNTIYQTSSPLQLTLLNFGASTLNISGVATFDSSGVNASADFSIGATTCGATLAAGTSCTYTIVFTPTNTGLRSGLFQLTDNDPAGKHLVTLSGTGIRSYASVSPSSLSFSAFYDSTSPVQSVTLTNNGTALMTISAISATNPLYGVTTTCGTTLAVSASCTISVNYSPIFNAPSNNGALTIFHNGTNGPTYIPLTGTPVYPTPAIISLSPSSVPTSTDFTLTVNGTGFYPTSSIYLNGTARTTTYVSRTQLATVVTYNDVLGVTPVTVSVHNPSGNASNTVNLTVTQNKAPEGALESALSATDSTTTLAEYSVLNVSGWAADPDDGSPIKSVRISVSTASATPNPGIYIASYTSNRLRKVDAAGYITTYAGTGVAGFGGDNGAAAAAQISSAGVSIVVPGVARDSSGNIFMTDLGNSRVRKISATTGIITTIAGNGTSAYGTSGVQATSTSVYYPTAIAVDSSGNVYFAENSSRIRKITVSTGVISTVAGSTSGGFTGDNGQAVNATFNGITGLAFDSADNLYIADYSNHRVRRILASTGIVSTIAGSALTTTSGDGGLATSAGFAAPSGIALDAAGNVYVTDSVSLRVRKFSVGGNINTIAGPGTAGTLGDGGPATSAYFGCWGIALDVAGNIYIADSANMRIRKIDATTGNISTVAGLGANSSTGDFGLATAANVAYPTSLVVIGGGTVYDRTVFATLGGSRPDIATAKNNPNYANSGWNVGANVGNLPPGTYTVHAVARDFSNAATTLFPDKTITITAASGPWLQMQSSSVAFNSTLINSWTSPQSFILTNGGNQPLLISSISATGDFVQTNNCSTLAPAATCTINVIFHPGVLGSRTGFLIVKHNGAELSSSVSLSGTCIDLPINLARPGRVTRGASSNVAPITSSTAPTPANSLTTLGPAIVVEVPQAAFEGAETPDKDNADNGKNKIRKKKRSAKGNDKQASKQNDNPDRP